MPLLHWALQFIHVVDRAYHLKPNVKTVIKFS